MSKRTLDAFFKPSSSHTPAAKKLKEHATAGNEGINGEFSKAAEKHPSYPFPIAQLPSPLSASLESSTPARQPRPINKHAHLDLLYYEPFIPQATASQYFQFLRRELPFYRVKYTAKRGPTETLINTPRFTTVFGVDITSYFSESHTHDGDDGDNARKLLDSKTHHPVPKERYKCTPRPIPSCLDVLRRQVEAALGDSTSYNFVLVNYYASGDDSISYHSDDERFLGANPSIASVTLGATRDFVMKRKTGGEKLQLALATGDMLVMRGETQSNWLHSVPKRKGRGAGRINITLRRAVVPGGTENYYRYNVGEGVYRWDDSKGMVLRHTGNEYGREGIET